jgi:hypothetical protein
MLRDAPWPGEPGMQKHRVPGSPQLVLGHPLSDYTAPASFVLQKVGMWRLRPKFPKAKLLRPPNNMTPKSLENLLPVFHFGVCVSFPHPCTNPSGEGKTKQGAKHPEKLALAAWILRHPLSCPPELGKKMWAQLGRSRPAHSPSELLVFAATSSFYRFGCAELRGYYRSNCLLPLSPPPSRPLFM